MAIRQNFSSHAVRTSGGQDAVLRVVAIRDEGREQLRIWRKLATAPHALISENHALPFLQELDLEHVTFAVFPYVAQPMDRIYGGWAKNSVGDILDAVMQALEGLAYIHALGIAHRDAFKYNFLMQFYPESLLTRAIPVSRPRVYLIDFETAIEFPADCPPSERLCVGLPCINSISDADRYMPPRIPEMDTGEPYDPFKLDVWQLATSLLDFDTTLPAVEEVFAYMRSDDPADRLTAQEALTRLRKALEDMPPKSLLIPPVIEHGPGCPSSSELRAMCARPADTQPQTEL
ncbi:kinase-like domain-containing protein [Schizophyllum commune]